MDIAVTTQNEVYAHLKAEYENNDAFRKDLEELYMFYGRKLLLFAKKEEHKEYIESNFGEVLNSLFYQGYYTMKLILSDKETVITPESWKVPEGVTKNDIPILLKTVLQEEKFDWKTEVSHEFSMDILTYMEPAYETTQKLTKEISEYGAYRAFIEDERYVGGDSTEQSDMLLGSPYDLNFLSPQVYSKAQFYTDQHEIWDLFYWSAVQEEGWVGTMHFSTIPVAENMLYIIEFSLSNLLIEQEKLDIVAKVTKSIPSEIRSNLQIRLYNVDELDILTASAD